MFNNQYKTPRIALGISCLVVTIMLSSTAMMARTMTAQVREVTSGSAGTSVELPIERDSSPLSGRTPEELAANVAHRIAKHKHEERSNFSVSLFDLAGAEEISYVLVEPLTPGVRGMSVVAAAEFSLGSLATTDRYVVQPLAAGYECATTLIDTSVDRWQADLNDGDGTAQVDCRSRDPEALAVRIVSRDRSASRRLLGVLAGLVRLDLYSRNEENWVVCAGACLMESQTPDATNHIRQRVLIVDVTLPDLPTRSSHSSGEVILEDLRALKIQPPASGPVSK